MSSIKLRVSSAVVLHNQNGELSVFLNLEAPDRNYLPKEVITMEFFKNFADALIEADRVKREADYAMDGKAVLTYMRAYMSCKSNDAPHRRTAKYFCKVFGNAWLSDYHCFRESKKVSDLFPRTTNIEELKEALNIGRKYLKEAGWKLTFFEDHIEWSFKDFVLKSQIMIG